MPRAGRNCIAVSALKPSMPPSFTPFLTRPYVANVNASAREIQGTLPYATAITTTAAAPTPTAVHCSGRSRSRSTRTPKAMLTSGLMK